jgi:hypothetical protein
MDRPTGPRELWRRPMFRRFWIGGGAAIASAGTLALSMFVLGVARGIFNITQLSLRLAITPDRMHGRLNATMRFVMWGVTPFGALGGGLLATTALQIHGTLVLAGLGVLAATTMFLLPAIRGQREIPRSAEPADDQARHGVR